MARIIEVDMAQEYFNHHATRVAIEISVALDDASKWMGTGFFVSESRVLPEGPKIDCLLLISNKHVLAEGVGAQVIFLNKKDANGEVMFGQQEAVRIDRAAHRYTGHSDEEIDLACLDMRGVQTKGYDVPELAPGFLDELDYERIGVGSEVLYAGYPNGMKDNLNGLALMRRGSVASIPWMDCDGKGLVAIDGTVLEGNSGGPVFVSLDDRYGLLGVMYAKSKIADDFGFAIKQEYVKQLIGDAVEKSANELRDVANSRILEEMRKRDPVGDAQTITDQVWREITDELNIVRNRGSVDIEQ